MTGKGKPAKPGPRDDKDLLRQAQKLIYDAWEPDDPAKRAALARKALKISPDCADAYVLMAEIATTPAQALELYRRGVAAGERALGQRAFVEDVGHFWGLLETRPYMRARAGLALSQWVRGQHDEAIAHWRAMLILEPKTTTRGLLGAYVLAAARPASEAGRRPVSFRCLP